VILAAVEVAFDIAKTVGSVAAVIAAIGAIRMRKESRPNSGSTMRDAIDRIEKASASTDRRLQKIELTLEDHTRRLDAGGSTMTRLSDRIDHLTDRTRK
jgi:hypothetical protein